MDLTNKIRRIAQEWKEEQEQRRKDAAKKWKDGAEQRKKDAILRAEQQRKDAILRAEQQRKKEELRINRITDQVLMCNPQKIAQELMNKLEENATAAVKRGECKSGASLIFWQTEHCIYESTRFRHREKRLEEIKAKGPIIGFYNHERREASEILFRMVKEHVTDKNIKLTLKNISNYCFFVGSDCYPKKMFSEGRQGQSIEAYISWEKLEVNIN